MNRTIEDVIPHLKTIIEKNIPKAEELLKTVVDINSHTDNKPGTDQVGMVFRRYFEELGFQTQVIPRSEVGDILIFSNEAFEKTGKGGVLFLSHMDTVFPQDGAVIPFRVADDKGGAVIAWQALNALKETGHLDRIPVRILLNSDEETGSYHSRKVIEEESTKAELVLVMEYGKPRPNGATVVTSRLGRGYLNINLTGENAESAMLEIIEQSYYMATPEDRRSIRIRNFHRDYNACSVRILFGFPNHDEGEYMLRALKKMINQHMNIKNVQGMVSGEINRPALLFGKRHWEMYEKMNDISRSLNFTIFSEHRSSCSDGSFVPDEIPVLDGIGPIADYVHTEEEFMTPESLAIRPLIITALMTELYG
jgi:hypothetical protein